MALKFGGVIGQPVALEMIVIASQENNNEQKKSNVVQITVTAFSGFGLTSTPSTVTTNSATPTAIGATFAWNHLSYSQLLGNNFWLPSTVLLCLGPITYLLCWLGWNAVSKRNRTYLKTVSC